MYLQPPTPDQIEVSLIGPGYGESIVMHLGDGDWAIIDSCIDSETKEIAPLRYLDALGVDVRQAVRLVLATHWHDDHVRGLAEVVRRADRADFVCSVALQSTEFMMLIAAGGQDPFIKSSGVREFRGILEILRAREVSPMWAISDRRVWTKGQDTVDALSPSNEAVTRAFTEFARLAPQANEPKRRITSQSPNDASVATWTTLGNWHLLFGADLEEPGDPRVGWSAVLASPNRPQGRAVVNKVAHHGSTDAHHDGIWEELLVSDPLAVLAPWVLGGGVLPSVADVRRICALAGSVLLTSPARYPAPVRHDARAERMIRESVRYIRQTEAPLGHVRLRVNRHRSDGASQWTSELFPPAHSAC
jgi:beta-lactamase superfamily II metal-dependent hydrolase